jgi:hypothetical protein
MNRALNQLILLGFICQSLSWDGWLLPLASVALWVVCLKIAARHPVLLSPGAECALLVVGSAGGILIGYLPDQSSHFFIGHGITLFQAGRLLRSLDRREQLFAMIAATVQLGVACTVVLDYRFIPILVVTAFLIPRALMELEGDHFPKSTYSVWPKLKWTRVFAVVAVMVVFFAVFPRGLLSSAFPALRRGPDHGSLLDSTLDSRRGGSGGSERVIMQIKGENLQYLRLFALTTFDGVKWHPDGVPGKSYNRFLPPGERDGYPHRIIRVKEVRNLGRYLPTDGRIVALEGRFFSEPRRTFHEFIECRSIWSTANNVYEYWLDPEPEVRGLGRRYSRALLNHPSQSARLEEWLETQLAGIDDPLEQARHLEDHFIENFEYELGAPALDRLNSIDDFIFNERRGHCERYASAMGLLLRMRGIPSRVMLGYVPGCPNWLTGWVNIRASDAHAWTEGWFPDRGWVKFDATPRSEIDLTIGPLRELIDALDVVWYVNIVNLDSTAQRNMLTTGLGGVAAMAGWARRNAGLLTPLVLLMAAMLAWRFRAAGGVRKDDREDPRQRNRILAEHYYGRLLKLLAKNGIDRAPSETPLEFLESLRQRRLPAFCDVAFITRLFCSTRYGEAATKPQDEADLKSALDRVGRSCSAS